MTISIKSPTSTTGSIQKNGSDVITIDASDNVTVANDLTATSFTGDGSQLTGLPNSYAGTKNLIINGNMQIAQRGTTFTGNEYTVDRFRVQNSTDGAYSVTQDTDVPAGQGFVNSLKYTVTTADTSLTTTQNTAIVQEIEGVNTTHLELGTANAKTFTISFWVKSSLTGTFGGALRNQGNTRAYVYTYNVNSANTWEKKTITIAGDTSGTWNTSTGVGIGVLFTLGCGPDLSDTAGAWYGANKVSATGAVELIGTLNATWQITGVQLEVGDTATDFENLQYGTQLALCQRYCYGQNNSASEAYYWFGIGFTSSPTQTYGQVTFPVTMRTKPSLTATVSNTFYIDNFTPNSSALIFDQGGVNGCSVSIQGTGGTLGRASRVLSNNTSAAYLIWSAEL